MRYRIDNQRVIAFFQPIHTDQFPRVGKALLARQSGRVAELNRQGVVQYDGIDFLRGQAVFGDVRHIPVRIIVPDDRGKHGRALPNKSGLYRT